MPANHLRTVRTHSSILSALAGVLAVALIALLLKLPERIQRGEEGQAAIQMLDAMRRPFLEIKKTEARLLRTLDAEAGDRELAIAVGSASDLLSRYQALARYSTPLSKSVAGLSQTFLDWVALERSLVSCVASAPQQPSLRLPGGCLVPGLASAADGFLTTLNDLGAGETPIHADIADGRAANHILQAAVGILLFYLAGLGFWSQRTTAKNQSVLLRDRLRAEQGARTLETALSEALAKVLGGFMAICANCKRVRVQEDEWTPIEAYVTKKTDAKFTHGICPQCRLRLYGGVLSRKSAAQGE